MVHSQKPVTTHLSPDKNINSIALDWPQLFMSWPHPSVPSVSGLHLILHTLYWTTWISSFSSIHHIICYLFAHSLQSGIAFSSSCWPGNIYPSFKTEFSLLFSISDLSMVNWQYFILWSYSPRGILQLSSLTVYICCLYAHFSWPWKTWGQGSNHFVFRGVSILSIHLW